jgi:hypothetical protein
MPMQNVRNKKLNYFSLNEDEAVRRVNMSFGR